MWLGIVGLQQHKSIIFPFPSLVPEWATLPSERLKSIWLRWKIQKIDTANQRITTILTKCVSTQETIQMYINKC